MARNLSSPSDVRAWALAQGLTVGERGRFQPAVIEAFNAAHKGKQYHTGQFVPTVVLTAKPEKGRAKTVRLTRTEVKAARARVGAGQRGRLTPAAKAAIVLGLPVPTDA